MNAEQFTKSILDLDNNILFTGVIEKSGHLNISSQREPLDNYLKGRNAELILSQSVYAVDLRKAFTSLFGNLNSVCYEYSSMKIIMIPVKDHVVFLLVNKAIKTEDIIDKILNFINSTKEIDLYSQ